MRIAHIHVMRLFGHGHETGKMRNLCGIVYWNVK